MGNDECKLVKWYNEVDGDARYKGSGVEIFMFYLSMITTFLLCLLVISLHWIWKFHFEFLFLLIPLPIWMFLRCSRKDMSATAYLIAGLFGAFGGALIVILEELFTR